MPTYATQSDCTAYTPGLQIEDPDEFDNVIDQAEKDIDFFLGPGIDETTGRRYNPADLEATQVQSLKAATCAQVEYRLLMGKEFFIGPKVPVEGSELTTQKRIPDLGPKARKELWLGGYINMTGRMV